MTKTDAQESDLAMGWYSKDDMIKVLKWNTSLFSKKNNFLLIEFDLYLVDVEKHLLKLHDKSAAS